MRNLFFVKFQFCESILKQAEVKPLNKNEFSQCLPTR